MAKYESPGAYTGQKATADHWGSVRLATQAEANAGTEADAVITALTLDLAADALIEPASETVAGKIEIADDTEALAFVETDKALVPSNLAAMGATETQQGILETADDTEALAFVENDKALVPSNLAAMGATTSQAGIQETALDAEADTATAIDKFLVPANLAALTADNLTVLTASDALVRAESSSSVYITPANLKALRVFDRVTFASQPIATQEDGTIASVVDTEINVMTCDGGVIFEYYNIGTQTAELVPRIGATGLKISRVETDDIGTEFGQGITAASRNAFTAQTDGPFYIRATINAVDVSGVNPLVVGFRKAEAYNSTYTGYSDFCSIGIVGENDPALLQIVTNIGGAGAVTTDTTDTVANGVNVTLEVIVGADGVVTYQINDGVPSTVAAYTLAVGVVVPFISFLHAATSPDEVFWIDYECGLV